MFTPAISVKTAGFLVPNVVMNVFTLVVVTTSPNWATDQVICYHVSSWFIKVYKYLERWRLDCYSTKLLHSHLQPYCFNLSLWLNQFLFHMHMIFLRSTTTYVYKAGRQGLFVAGPKMWNSLPTWLPGTASTKESWKPLSCTFES